MSWDLFTSKTKQFDHQQFVENYYKAYEKEDIDFLRKYFIEDNIEWFGQKDPLTNDEVIERHFSKFNKEDFLETNIFNLEIIKIDIKDFTKKEKAHSTEERIK